MPMSLNEQSPKEMKTPHLERTEPTVLTIEPRLDSWQSGEERAAIQRTSKQSANIGREGTTSSSTKEEAILKIRRGELFERPRVAVLDHASAISLDEFWNKNETASTINRG